LLSQDEYLIMKHATILAGGLLDCKSVYGESISWYMPLRPEDLPATPTEQGPHEIEIDVLCLVSANHNLTVQAIAQDQKRLRERWENGRETYTNEEFCQEMLQSEENFYEDLRVAARSQAVVALITRMQHWASKYARRLDKNRNPKSLKKELEFLNAQIKKDGPEEVAYFVQLVDLRDSVIHADSKPHWKYQGDDRSVVPRYAPNSWRVEISEIDLQYAVAKAIKQMLWYDEQLRANGK
jgi:hypothetical protein